MLQGPQTGTAPAEPDQPTQPLSTQPLMQAKSRWVPVAWSELPGFAEDRLGQAWGAKLRSCERPAPALAAAWLLHAVLLALDVGGWGRAEPGARLGFGPVLICSDRFQGEGLNSLPSPISHERLK